ncbi:hypothetical protein NAT65_28655 [Achromobacter xylosoxidans]|uniref:hypothetical protein n=1 Tax=Achromobacter TaxID=222 RepID=UPI00203CD2D0|nr:hypothetical protein [Achromobacter xylosoxidans]MCM2575084.1 hypothetical protein [Achromobacter xylosoxidans]
MNTIRVHADHSLLASAPREHNETAASVLPLEYRLALQSAAGVKNPHQRAKAIAKATERAKRAHPEFFR